MKCENTKYNRINPLSILQSPSTRHQTPQIIVYPGNAPLSSVSCTRISLIEGLLSLRTVRIERISLQQHYCALVYIFPILFSILMLSCSIPMIKMRKGIGCENYQEMWVCLALTVYFTVNICLRLHFTLSRLLALHCATVMYRTEYFDSFTSFVNWKCLTFLRLWRGFSLGKKKYLET